MKQLSIFFILTLMLMMCGCASTPKTVEDVSTGTVHVISFDGQPKTVDGSPNQFIPKAVVYKTNGHYEKHVMVNVNSGHTAITNYPAITDITATSEPVVLGDGWLLDRRGGIGPNSVFLQYTYPEYAALKTQPNARELFAKIIPGSAVTQYMVLPITINEAIANPELAKKYIER